MTIIWETQTTDYFYTPPNQETLKKILTSTNMNKYWNSSFLGYDFAIAFMCENFEFFLVKYYEFTTVDLNYSVKFSLF